MICEKISSVETVLGDVDRSDKAFSDTSMKIAQKEGFDSPEEMFQKIGLD